MTRLAVLLASVVIVAQAAAQPVTQPPVQPEWFAGAVTFMPDGYVAGMGFAADNTDPADTKALTGYIAAYPKTANDPKTPASAFDAGHMLVVTLNRVDGKLKAVSGELRPRDKAMIIEVARVISAARDETEYDALNAELQAKAKSLPAGTMPCDLHGWSDDKDPKGLNVRAAPDAKSKVLGTLPPPYKFKAKNGSENAPDSGWLTEFAIIGYTDGWFLIEGAQPPGKDYEGDAYPRNHPKPYAGRGWVAASKVGAQYANGDTRMGGLFQAPHTDANWMPAKTQFGNEISADGGPKKVLACSGFWALVESHDKVRGWWRRLCSSQVTNCS
ncbi:MAG: SH3 domain-containing protein [Afipia sp.]|nr:SH3 domain-containing protein [Afipia sp.]